MFPYHERWSVLLGVPTFSRPQPVHVVDFLERKFRRTLSVRLQMISNGQSPTQNPFLIQGHCCFIIVMEQNFITFATLSIAFTALKLIKAKNFSIIEIKHSSKPSNQPIK